MTPPSAGGVAGVLESLSVKWHMEANALDKSFSPGSGIMAAERRARALELEAALAAIGSAAPAGDGEMQCVGIVVEAPNGGLAISTPAAPAGGGDDLVARLERSLRDLGEHRQTHVVWRDWLLKDPANEQVNPHAGSAKFHDDTIKDYDRHLAAIEEAINRLASTQAAGGGGELPEAEELARDLEALVCVATSGTPRLILSRASALIRRLASTGSAPAPSAWRPIESAPKDGRVVLLVRTGWPAYSGRWHNGDWTDAEDAIRYPEFWMPVPTLPAAPTQEPQP